MLVSPQIPAKWRNLFWGKNEVLWNKTVTCKEEIFPIFPSFCIVGFPGGRFCVWDVFQRVSLESIPMGVEGRHRIDQGRNVAVMWDGTPSQSVRLALELKCLIRFPASYWNSHDLIHPSQSAIICASRTKGHDLGKGSCLQLWVSWTGSRMKGKFGWCIFTSTAHSVLFFFSCCYVAGKG